MIRIFRHYVPRSLIYLWFAEAVVLCSSVYLSIQLRFMEVVGSEFISEISAVLPKALIFVLLTQALMGSMGLYGRQLRDGAVGLLLRIGLSFFLAFLISAVLFYFVPELHMGLGVLGVAFLIALLGILLIRITFLHLQGYEQLKNRVLVLGTGSVAAHISELRRKSDWRGLSIIGFVSFSEETMVPKNKVIVLTEPLRQFVERNCIDEIVVALTDRRRALPVDEILDCKMAGVPVSDVLCFFEKQVGKIKLDFLNPSWLIFSDGFLVGTLRQYIKRSFDILSSSVVLLLAWPLMLAAIIAIYIEEGFSAPILYRQIRIGEGGEEFGILKFRSMSVDAEKDGKAQWAQKADPRVTRVGGFIRKVRIDELPQLFNILKGDMSFVGPRPERPQFVEELAQEIPYFKERHRVKPGLTGWAQINYPYGSSVQDSKEKLQYDLYYAKNYSVFLDLLILFQTAQVVIFGKGR